MLTECSIEAQFSDSIHVHVGGTGCYIIVNKKKDLTTEWFVGSSKTNRNIAYGNNCYDSIDALTDALSVFFLEDIDVVKFKARQLLNASILANGVFTKICV